MVWLLPGALANSIVADFRLSDSQKGLMVAVSLLGGAGVRAGPGFLSPPVGARRGGPLGGRGGARAGPGIVDRPDRRAADGPLGDGVDAPSPAARLALGRLVRGVAARRPPPGGLGGELRRGAAARQPLVPAAVPGAGH